LPVATHTSLFKPAPRLAFSLSYTFTTTTLRRTPIALQYLFALSEMFDTTTRSRRNN
jgi:hypothetical protein